MTQREVGIDTPSVRVAVRAALRQDPDVIMVGDVHDAETLDTAIKAAETGRLVIGAMPTADVVTTVGQVLAMLPREERDIGRVRLSEALSAIVAQQLVPKKEGGGRVVAVEILIATPPVRDALKDVARIVELKELMTRGGRHGMQTYAQHFAELVKAGLVAPQTARAILGDDASAARGSGKR